MNSNSVLDKFNKFYNNTNVIKTWIINKIK